MSELSGLELRKAALTVLGFKWYSGRSIGNTRAVSRDNHHGLFDPHGFDIKELSEVHTSMMIVAPAIERDPAVSIPALEKFCEKHNATAKLYFNIIIGDDPCLIEISFRDLSGWPGPPTTASGANPSEAISRAIVASQKEEGV